MGFNILTYRKGRTRHIAEKRFTRHKAKLDGRWWNTSFMTSPFAS